jgi:hypothetical protein
MDQKARQQNQQGWQQIRFLHLIAHTATEQPPARSKSRTPTRSLHHKASRCSLASQISAVAQCQKILPERNRKHILSVFFSSAMRGLDFCGDLCSHQRLSYGSLSPTTVI